MLRMGSLPPRNSGNYLCGLVPRIYAILHSLATCSLHFVLLGWVVLDGEGRIARSIRARTCRLACPSPQDPREHHHGEDAEHEERHPEVPAGPPSLVSDRHHI